MNTAFETRETRENAMVLPHAGPDEGRGPTQAERIEARRQELERCSSPRDWLTLLTEAIDDACLPPINQPTGPEFERLAQLRHDLLCGRHEAVGRAVGQMLDEYYVAVAAQREGRA